MVQQNSPAQRTTQPNNTPFQGSLKRGRSYCRVCGGKWPLKGSAPWERQNPESRRVSRKPFKLGEPLMWPELIDMLPTRMRELHQWYMKYFKGHVMFATRIKDRHFHRGMDYVWIELENLWDLYHQDALDKSLLSAWCM